MTIVEVGGILLESLKDWRKSFAPQHDERSWVVFNQLHAAEDWQPVDENVVHSELLRVLGLRSEETRRGHVEILVAAKAVAHDASDMTLSATPWLKEAYATYHERHLDRLQSLFAASDGSTSHEAMLAAMPALEASFGNAWLDATKMLLSESPREGRSLLRAQQKLFTPTCWYLLMVLWLSARQEPGNGGLVWSGRLQPGLMSLFELGSDAYAARIKLLAEHNVVHAQYLDRNRLHYALNEHALAAITEALEVYLRGLTEAAKSPVS